MKHIFILLAVLVFTFTIQAQVPVPMSSQPALTYTETFDSIGFWTNGFASGPGVERFAPVLPGGINPIPDPTRIITSSATFTTGSSGGLHIDSAGGRLLMLVTGTTNNTSSLAFDFFMDFSGINAGTLSFDWQTVFNGATSSNRTGTLRVYASTDGINFTELSGATVTVTNYVPGTGTVSVTLPASFNNNPDARLRFYYYNSAGGTTGSRPLIALDNLKIIAAGQPCSTPSASPTTLAFTNITATSFDASFTAANPSPDEYVVIITANNNLTANPPDGYVFNPGDNVGDGIVVYRGSNTSFSAQNLDPQTNYTVYVFSLNIYCNGTISYRTSDPLTNTITTPAGPPCVTPSAQPGNLQFTNVTASSITGTFNSVADASEYLVLQSTSPVASVPINGTVYFPGDQIGTATVVYRGGANSFTSLALNHSTTYYFKIFSLNNFACSNGPVYQTSAPLSGQQATQIVPPCQAPAHNAWNLILLPGEHEITGFFNPYNDAADSYLVVMSTNSSLSAFPQDGLNYAPGSALGNATVVSTGSNFCFATSGLATNTTYHFFVFSYNHLCIGGPLYRTGGYLSGSTTTTTAQPFNYYFGNLHAHSSFSDGNQDNPSLTAADNYAYAKNSL